ncbi:MAG: ATP-binding protein [Candidatus Zixiibacteriota bacterium]|nr:MAG: ATP-binding protein [candidate division Zixibacteria bacterium]
MSIRADNLTVVTVPRDLSEQSLADFEQAVNTLLQRLPGGLELDCSELGLVSSSHVNVLWTVREKCLEARVPLRLCHVTPGLIRILRILDLIEFFQLDTDLAEDKSLPLGQTPPAEDDRRFEIDLKPKSEEILDSLNRFRQFLKDLKVDPMCALELEIVFYETLTNIRAHGHVDAADLIKVRVEADDTAIELTFIDGGRAFNPAENIPKHDAAQAVRSRQKHGFGLTMIVRMTDAMDYERVDDKLNVLKLKKYWSR